MLKTKLGWAALAWAFLQGAGGQGKPAPKEPTKECSAGRIVEGHKCVPCKRILGEDDVRGGRCKRCEEVARTVEYCLKATAPFFQASCHPEKKGPKPLYC